MTAYHGYPIPNIMLVAYLQLAERILILKCRDGSGTPEPLIGMLAEFGTVSCNLGVHKVWQSSVHKQSMQSSVLPAFQVPSLVQITLSNGRGPYQRSLSHGMPRLMVLIHCMLHGTPPQAVQGLSPIYAVLLQFFNKGLRPKALLPKLAELNVLALRLNERNK